MILSFIVAMDEKGGIGKDNRIPWRLSADLKLFKTVTMGHTLLMGRKTFESVGKILPGRVSIVLSRNEKQPAPGAIMARSFCEAVQLAEANGEKELFIIGGGEVFHEALPLADQIYLTRVHVILQCDVYFPEEDWERWVVLEQGFHPQDEKNEFPFTFSRRLKRSNSGGPNHA